MIPFITRHLFNLPRTAANCNKTRQKLRNLGHGIACLLGALFLAACAAWIVVMAFAI